MSSGPCAKTHVKCTIVSRTGKRYIGTNSCRNSQRNCPRLPGEDYTKCHTICQTDGHAEEVALRLAGDDTKGSWVFIEGHEWCCQNCQKLLWDAGVMCITVGQPPHNWDIQIQQELNFDL